MGGHPQTSIADENIRAVREIFEEDRRQTANEIASLVCLNHGVVHLSGKSLD